MARTQSKACELDYYPGGNIIPGEKGVFAGSTGTRAASTWQPQKARSRKVKGQRCQRGTWGGNP